MVDDDTKLEVFAALLHERHVLVTSSRLGRLSACVQVSWLGDGWGHLWLLLCNVTAPGVMLCDYRVRVFLFY